MTDADLRPALAPVGQTERVPVDPGIAGWVVSSGQPVAVADVARDPRFAAEVAEATGYVPRSVLAMSLQTERETLGVIEPLAPEAELYRVRVLGARLTGKRDYFAVFHELVDEAYFANLMLVCAVNNVAGPTYPSQYAAVFSVAANEATDSYRFDYNPAPPVEFAAPHIAGLVVAPSASTPD